MNQTAKEIIEKLEQHGFCAYIVGGYVRDFLLSKTTNDIDICTNATTKEIMKLFSGTANEYGSFHLKKNQFNIDITTFRKEKNYSKRRPTSIFYTEDLKTDLLRRDFTINTICMDKNGEIIDELCGKQDLKGRIIRMVGNVKTKIEEDPLRILRAIRFATVLDFSLETSLQEEIKNNRELVGTLSSYRIKEEFSKIFLSPNYQKGLSYLREFHLCEVLGIDFTNVVYTKDLCGMWAQFQIKKDLPFTKNEKENIVKLQEIMSLKMISRDVIYKYGLYLSLVAGEILGVSADTIYKMEKALPIHAPKDLALSFQEVCEILQVHPSKKVKEIVEELIHEVLYEHITNEKSVLKQYLLINKERWYN